VDVFHGDPRLALDGAAVVCTDVWTSMGQEVERDRRRAAFAGYTVNDALMAAAPPQALVMHCLPAHRGEEIDEPWLWGPRSLVERQAANRLPAARAVLAALAGPAAA
jgi:ornithine carbamoyltransferase